MDTLHGCGRWIHVVRGSIGVVNVIGGCGDITVCDGCL